MAKMIIIAITSIAHTKIGMRAIDIPGALSLKIVTTISMAATSAEISSMPMALTHRSIPIAGVKLRSDESGACANQPASGPRPRKNPV